MAFRLFLKARKILIQTYKYISTVRTINTVTEGNPGDLPMGAFLGVGSYSEWWGLGSPVISKSVFRYRKVPFYSTSIGNVSFYGKLIDIDIDAQY